MPLFSSLTAVASRSAAGALARARGAGTVAAAGLLALMVGACGSLSVAGARRGVISAVGAENEYANVLEQIGGRYVHVSSILNDPNTDPHTFESSPSVAQQVASAQLIVQNGAGYDTFMQRIEAASPNPRRRVIVVGRLLGLPADVPNPHLWYAPRTMPAVAAAIAADLSALQPSHASYFRTNLASFDASLAPLRRALAAFRARYAGTAVATTEPVADYLLQAMGLRNLTPIAFQADVMNGVDPAPEDIALETGLLTGHRVRLLCYNEQVADPLTASILRTALRSRVPVVGVYETMPTPGYDFQSWMLAEVDAIERAVTVHASTQRL